MKIPKYNIGDIVGTKTYIDRDYNERYLDPSKIVKIEYGFIPYLSSNTYYPDKQFIYILKDKRTVAEKDIVQSRYW